MNDLIEAWRIVADDPSYSVSDHGRVRRRLTNHILKPTKLANGTLVVSLGLRTVTVARLVYESFIGDSQRKHIVFLDGNPSNCSAFNLELASPPEEGVIRNVPAKVRRGGRPGNKVRLTSTGEIFDSQMAAADYLGVTRSIVGRHLKGNPKTVKGHILEWVKD